MPTIPQRIASAFAVLCGRYGDVTRMAQDREQSRQSLYHEAAQLINAVDGVLSAGVQNLSASCRAGREANGCSGGERLCPGWILIAGRAKRGPLAAGETHGGLLCLGRLDVVAQRLKGLSGDE